MSQLFKLNGGPPKNIPLKNALVTIKNNHKNIKKIYIKKTDDLNKIMKIKYK